MIRKSESVTAPQDGRAGGADGGLPAGPPTVDVGGPGHGGLSSHPMPPFEDDQYEMTGVMPSRTEFDTLARYPLEATLQDVVRPL